MLKSFVKCVLKYGFRVRLSGAELFPPEGQPALIVANHVSYLDAALLALFLPESASFAINTQVAQLWYVRPLLRLGSTFMMDPANPMAAKAVIRELRKGRKCVIFPEGRITVTGSLMKVYEGPAVIADRAGVPLIPVRIDGAEYSYFSYLGGKVRRRLFPRIRLTVRPPVQALPSSELTGKARRQAAGAALYNIMREMLFETSPYRTCLTESLYEAAAVHGFGRVIAEDHSHAKLTYLKLLVSSAALGGTLDRRLPADKPFVGVMLPTSCGALVVFFALQQMRKTPAMLNVTAGQASVLSACRSGALTHVLTSRAFVAAAKAEGLIASLQEAGIQCLYLEDIRPEIGFSAKASAFWHVFAKAFLPCVSCAKAEGASPDDPAVILFTSGSEGAPKGVALSHANVQANRYQLAATVDFGPTDVVFNPLPMFHAFGLTAGALLPVFSGLKVFLYPSPLHYRAIAELIYDQNATILFGADTFLTGYARAAHPYDFRSLRYVFAGAEKVKERTRQLWEDRFGLRILEGYGATETAPALSINTPMRHKAGSVGLALPGVKVRIHAIPGVEEGGELIVSGPNVMLGYLKEDRPGVIVPPEAGEYATGDVVVMDDEGFLTLKGRLKRFAKIGGEMVSLAMVEAMAEHLYPDFLHAAVALPDPVKGEQIALVTTCPQADRKALSDYASGCGVPELALPKRIVRVDEMPLLPAGKADYRAARAIAERFLSV